MKKKLIGLGLLVSSMFLLVGFLAPTLVSAQEGVKDKCESAIAASNTLGRLLCRVGVLLNSVVPILITLAVVYFIWGIIHYAIARDEEAKTSGRDAMIWGLIALLVIVSVWGLVNFLKSFIGIPDNPTIIIPCVESNGVDCPQ